MTADSPSNEHVRIPAGPAGHTVASDVAVHAVTPESGSGHGVFATSYRERLTATALASESAGWEGILVPHNLHEVDPWMIASYLGSVTDRLTPLVAVQPACIPPHTAATCAAAYAALYGRPLHFNLVIGARNDEMARIGDGLGHDERYARLRFYARILKDLLNGESVTAEGFGYDYRGLRLEPRSEVLERCMFFVAGSSPASMAAAFDVADVMVTHPAPPDDWQRALSGPVARAGYRGGIGIRIGLLCRPDADEAWRLARERFPGSWLGRQETLLKTRSPSAWSRDLARRAMAEEESGSAGAEDGQVYWLGAFRSGLASSPFLVGSYEQVAADLREYLAAGAGHVLLNGGPEEDFPHVRRVIERAAA